MKASLITLLFSISILLVFGANDLKAQTDTIQYLFMGHPRDDNREHEWVLPTVEHLDYSKFDLLLLGGDLCWNTSAKVSTLEYCDSVFHLGAPTTHLAMGNHDMDNLPALLSFTKKERFYSFSRNNITFIVLDTEIGTPNITGSQLTLIQEVADTINQSDYLVIVHHRIIWMADNPDLAYLKDSVAASSKNLSSSNFFDEVYPELQKVKSKGIPVYCVAGDRTDVNIEYAKEDSIQFIASGMVGTFTDENNYAVVFTHFPQEHLLNYDFVTLSELDTLTDSTGESTNHITSMAIGFKIYPNPCSDKIELQLNEPAYEATRAEIFSVQGIKRYEVVIPQFTNSFTINLTSLSKGFYYIRLSNNHRSQTEKIILK